MTAAATDSTRTVVVADDDPDYRSALAQLIRQEPGLELLGLAADADEALRLARDLQPDVVLVDVKMPGGGGPAVARELKRAAPGAVALALSAYDDAATVLEMLDAGAVGYLVKGASALEIAEGVRSSAATAPRGGAEPPAPTSTEPESQATAVTVLVADDNADYLDALAHLIATDPSLTLMGKAADVRQAVRLAAMYLPDIALLDVQMTGGGGARAAREIREVSPATTCIALSFHTDRAAVIDMLRAGVASYIVKTISATELLASVHRSAQGIASLSPEISGQVLEELTVEAPTDAGALEKRRHDRELIESILAHAALRMVFQPIVDVSSRRPIGMEALARFDGESSRTPDVWFRDAAAVGLGVDLELLAARLATDQLAALPDDVDLFINLSPEAICSPELDALLVNVPPERIVIEVTEHAQVADYVPLGHAIDGLRGQGARLAVDDVGAGYASLQHILQLNPDVLKLDLSLCRSIDADPARRFLAQGLANFARSIWAKVVAEGVETAAELATVSELGITCAQGHYLGRPAPLDPAAVVPGHSDRIH